MTRLLFAGAISMMVSLLGTKALINWLTARRIGQPIRDDGPDGHQVKAGTPTMGGLAIVAGATSGYVVSDLVGAIYTRTGIFVMLAIIGGAKVSSKLSILENLVDRVDKLIGAVQALAQVSRIADLGRAAAHAAIQMPRVPVHDSLGVGQDRRFRPVHHGADRALIDGVLYRPVSARYKVYIIDEVHMLSRNAFNALLKTLEEPPEHVKFIFATTEIRRVPVTVLSRCQRFDLRRVKFDVLVDHFAGIAEKEGANITRGAIGLIARAADGSVRDGLSLLDQAIAHSGPETEIGEDVVREMLGVAERVQVFDLFERLMKGEIADALERFDSMYHAGADPGTILQDLAELTHWLTRLKAAPDAAEATPTSDLDLDRGRDVSSRLPMSALARTWQILLKGLAEVRTAHSATQAAEMVLVRIAYAAELPTPAEAI